MLKLFYFILVLCIIMFLILCCGAFNCAHDQIVEKYPLLLKRSVKYKNITEQRSKNISFYDPLQVHFYVDNFDMTITPNVIHNIEIALRNARRFIAETFKVYKRKQPFVLERKSCIRRWQSGINKGKCSRITSEPEVCVSQEITYPIPNRFLDKMELYDFDKEKPSYELPSGTGLLTSNFITFVTSESSGLCEGSDVSAFGTYCRLDQETNEPLAGILNLCPAFFARKVYPAAYYYNVILHEMFHILGFSIHLFEKFLPCEKGIYCDVPKNVIQTDSYGVPRLLFPLVIKHMQKQFSCSNSDYGGPMVLEVTNSTDEEEDETKQYTSHWDPILMYSSVMMAKFSEHDHIFVDNVTLSVFESTGWYLVNYSQADDFRFGKGEGCEFGLNKTCANSSFLCDPNAESNLGCDLLHKSIGKCTALSSQRTCGVYEPYDKENCESKLGNKYGLDFNALGFQHKCFMLTDENDNITTTCLPVKCETMSNYYILINMTWYECTSQKKIDVKNLSVFCPERTLFCTDEMIRKNVKPETCLREDSFYIAVRMYFTRPSFPDLYREHTFKNFKVTTVKGIAERLEMPVNYIVNASLSVFKKVQLDFVVCPSLSLGEEQINKIINKVQSFLNEGDFMMVVNSNMTVSSSYLNIEALEVIKFSDHEGFRTLLIFPVLCAIFLTATLVASVIRLLITKKH